MTGREAEIAAFLSGTPWQSWNRQQLAGDASMRRYERLYGPNGKSAVLMDAPVDCNGPLDAYLNVTNILQARAVSVPKVLHQDPDAGLLLLEDLGDALFATVITETPVQEGPLYEAATDLLVTLHQQSCPDLPHLTPPVLTEMTSLAFTEYHQAIFGNEAGDLRISFQQKFETILHEAIEGEMGFVHRDFHAQNLMWLPNRAGSARVGVIDFQDACCGHPTCDLVSLLQDARRDVPAEIEQQMITRYLLATGRDSARFRIAYSLIGVQRNMRILGIFARLARKMGKPQYLGLLPRVWGHFTRGLTHPALAPIADDLRAALPAPTADVLRKLTP
jgi:aminoglycoside/choline kinase family phosphotransferase